MSYEQRVENYQKFKDISYYLIIAVVSFASVSFLPFIGSTLSGDIVWPKTRMEWAIWIIARLLVSIINIVIFHSFLQQAKVNVKEDKNYLLAIETLAKVNKHKNLKPRSPKRYFGNIWGTKGLSLFVSSIASSVVLAEAMLSFELNVFLSYVFTIFMAIIFGYLQMRSSEDYWTSEFLAYANDQLSRIELTKSEG